MPPSLRRPARLLALALALAAAPGTARADEVSGTRSEELKERRHEVSVTLDHGHARLTVRRTVYNGGPRHDQATFWIDVPERSVATGLRTLGTLNGRPHWFAGELLEAETAAARYQELTGIGGYYPKDPALLSWRSQGTLALQVFPCPPAEEKTIEYSLDLPAPYREGRYRFDLSRLGTDALAARVVVAPAHPRDQVFVGDRPVAPGSLVKFDGDVPVELSLARWRAPTVDGGLAVVDVGDRDLVHFDVEAAARLSEIPQGAHVVVLIDASRSAADRIAPSLAAARAYLEQFAAHGGKAEVIAFDREVRPRHGKFVSIAHALADLDGLELTPRNGSAVDAALDLAAQTLARAPKGAPRRVVLMTDTLTRSALTVDRVRAAARTTGAVVHVATVEAGAPALQRDDDAKWAAVARVTGGVLWSAYAPEAAPNDSDAAALRQVYEEWARPLRIDRLQLHAPGLTTGDMYAPETLDEGAGVDVLTLATARVPYVKLTGELWSRPVREVLLASDGEAKLWSALTFGSDLIYDLTEPEMMVLAIRGGAVSPVTSYLAIEPGVRPSTEGLDWNEGVGWGGGASGLGLVGVGSGAGSMALPPFDHRGHLARLTRDALTTCGAPTASATVELETNRDEIVDLPRVEVKRDAGGSIARCLTAELWDAALPFRFEADWASWTVTT